MTPDHHAAVGIYERQSMFDKACLKIKGTVCSVLYEYSTQASSPSSQAQTRLHLIQRGAMATAATTSDASILYEAFCKERKKGWG
jgi:hypothetical protein